MGERHNILIVNPGSTSTKIAFYNGTEEICTKNYTHPREEIAKCKNHFEQLPLRVQALRDFLAENNIKKEDVDFIVPRYITIPRKHPGHFAVNQELIDYINSQENTFHIMALAPLIPYAIFGLDVPMAVRDSDAYTAIRPEFTVTGIPGITRSTGGFHTDNTFAVLNKLSAETGRKLEDMRVVVAHLGGGVSFSLADGGKVRYSMFDGEACFSPERCGAVPLLPFIDMCYDGEHTKEQMVKYVKGAGGLVAYFGTNNALEIENRALAGDEEAKRVYDGMLIRACACIGEVATLAKGKVDYIILTGGLVRGKYVRDFIEDYVGYIAPVKSYPGEFEMESFAGFALDIMEGRASAAPYAPPET